MANGFVMRRVERPRAGSDRSCDHPTLRRRRELAWKSIAGLLSCSRRWTSTSRRCGCLSVLTP